MGQSLEAVAQALELGQKSAFQVLSKKVLAQQELATSEAETEFYRKAYTGKAQKSEDYALVVIAWMFD